METAGAVEMAEAAGVALMAFRSMFTAEYPMMSAAANMISQPGETDASHTPRGEVSAPPRPAATPSAGMQVLWRTCSTTPETDVGTMVNSDVAVAPTGAMPNARRNIGTKTVPPPMPSSPDKTPTPTPTKAGTMKAARTSI